MTPGDRAAKPRNDPVALREIAGRWRERLQREKVSESTRAAFESWIDQCPEHREAYAQAERLAERLRAAAESPQILALRHETALRLTRRASGRHRLAAALAASAALAFVTVNLLAPHFTGDLAAWVKSWGPQAHHYATGTGERLAATLKDGSQVTLDTKSELEVAFTDAERTVRLVRGQAYFEVAKDKKHPFVVEVDGRRLVAVGTAFDVRVEPGRVQVTMVEGTVRVEPAGPPAAVDAGATLRSGDTGSGGTRPASGIPQTLISAGEQLLIRPGSADYVRPGNSDLVTSWRRGQLIFHDVRLEDAVFELNRYSDTQVSLQDPELADIRISGSFATGQPELFVEAVTTYFPIAVGRRSSEHIVLRVRRP